MGRQLLGERAISLPYTICFCRRGDDLLMLYRSKPPNLHRWNGLGGKCETGETPLDCVRREVREEAGTALAAADAVCFAGIVTWPAGADPTGPSQGMYAFVADFPADWPVWEGDRRVPEGLLRWQPTHWVCDPANTTVVDNPSRILPLMLASATPVEYYCDYQGDRLAAVVVRPLARHHDPRRVWLQGEPIQRRTARRGEDESCL